MRAKQDPLLRANGTGALWRAMDAYGIERLAQRIGYSPSTLREYKYYPAHSVSPRLRRGLAKAFGMSLKEFTAQYLGPYNWGG